MAASYFCLGYDRPRPELVIIAAVSDNGVIGIDGKVPWRIPEDMKRFKELTTGYPVFMGRKTFESLPRPLPGRKNVVLSSTMTAAAEGVRAHDSLEQALLYEARVDQDGNPIERAFIIGGEAVFARGLRYVDRLEITHVHQTVDGTDVKRFPAILPEHWALVLNQPRDGYDFSTYLRKCEPLKL